MSLYVIKDIKPNPFRDLGCYKIRRDKIEALRDSIRTTGFWDNIVARLVDGKPEIAYGHHRLIALEEEFGRDRKVKLNIRNLDDATMLQIMAHENMEEWGTSAAVTHETIRAVVGAYAEGHISLPPVPQKTKKSSIRYAPSFLSADDSDAVGDHPYTAQMIADFLGLVEPTGRPQKRLLDALAALELIELGVLEDSVFEGLSSKQCRALIEETRKRAEIRQARALLRQGAEVISLHTKHVEKLSREAHLPKTVQKPLNIGKQLGEMMRRGEIGYRGVRSAAVVIDMADPTQKRVPGIDAFAEELAKKIGRLLHPEHDEKAQHLEEIIKHKDHLSPLIRKEFKAVIMSVVRRLDGYIEALKDSDRED